MMFDHGYGLTIITVYNGASDNRRAQADGRGFPSIVIPVVMPVAAVLVMAIMLIPMMAVFMTAVMIAISIAVISPMAAMIAA
jgi:hypothetical protein